MRGDELIRRGAQVMTICNACRYCEQYCPVFPAMEQRLAFAKPDLTYLANLCHNCGECLYACQYAPPHEFGVNVPRVLAQIRAQSYEECCRPRFLRAAFRLHSLETAVGLAAGLITLMLVSTVLASPAALRPPSTTGDFYAVVPHAVMVALFGGVFGFVLIALGLGVATFWRGMPDGRGQSLPAVRGASALGDVLTLRHLHGSGLDCPSAEETRAPFRRWFHHCTFYGFILCAASTSVAAVYHGVFGWQAPYGYTSLPVLLGTGGGLGLLVGPAGLLFLRKRRDPALGDPARDGLDVSFIALLFLTSLTGLLLLVLRHQRVMGPLLIVHLGTVLALVLTLPCGKFVHGLYRTAALFRFAADRARGG